MALQPAAGVRDLNPREVEGNRRIADQLAAVIAAREFRLPPTEVIFIDRKASGLYSLLTTLGARTQARPLLERALSEPDRA